MPSRKYGSLPHERVRQELLKLYDPIYSDSSSDDEEYTEEPPPPPPSIVFADIVATLLNPPTEEETAVVFSTEELASIEKLKRCRRDFEPFVATTPFEEYLKLITATCSYCTDVRNLAKISHIVRLILLD